MTFIEQTKNQYKKVFSLVVDLKISYFTLPPSLVHQP